MAAKLYKEAANVIQASLRKEGSVKTLCFQASYPDKRQIFALVLETLKRRKLLEKVLSECEIDLQNNGDIKLSEPLKLVLLYEQLYGRGIPVKSKFYDIFHEHDDAFRRTHENICRKHPALANAERKKVNIPRYVRVNTLKTTLEQAINVFEEIGFVYKDVEISLLANKEFTRDKDVKDLLVFPTGTDLHKCQLYKDGEIFLQDKASCLPAFILDPPKKNFIIDACAAPGNKTSHLACIIQNKGRIHAFDLDKTRLNTMRKLLSNSGATCVKTKHQDFLKIKHDNPVFKEVQYILLDPSCSGSGILSRMDNLVDDDSDSTDNVTETTKKKDRLKRLSGFQTAALSHALGFPNLKKLAYSTCSVHKEENEDVVEKACKRFADKFQLVDAMPSWKNRGVGDWEEARKCIRAVPELDHTNGFFVALFERIDSTSENHSNGLDANATDKTDNEVSYEHQGIVKRKISGDEVKTKNDKKQKMNEQNSLSLKKTENSNGFSNDSTDRLFAASVKRSKGRKRVTKKPVTS